MLTIKKKSIYDPPRESNPEKLPSWENPEYNTMSRQTHSEIINFLELKSAPINLFKEFFPDKIVENIRIIINKYARQYLLLNLPRKPRSQLFK